MFAKLLNAAAIDSTNPLSSIHGLDLNLLKFLQMPSQAKSFVMCQGVAMFTRTNRNRFAISRISSLTARAKARTPSHC